MSLGIGPIIFDLTGPELSAEERELLQHPLIGGVIFFARNYESPEQITQLAAQIRRARKQPVLLTVDQEGGRVQRFRSGFTPLPDMRQLGRLYDESPAGALELATACGWLMAAEVLAVGVDLSFAPVLDIDTGINPAIAGRGFHHDSAVIIQLAKAFTLGMKEAGMAAVGKHFPGHGSVTVDSHLDLPVDARDFKLIEADDMPAFVEMTKSGIEGVMAAHILFSAVDAKPVGFSRYWLRDVLRQRLNFTGMIFSDDLSMEGASIAGGFPERVHAALEAGCDMALVCNNRGSLIKTLDGLSHTDYVVSPQKFALVKANFSAIPSPLKKSTLWLDKYNILCQLESELKSM